MSFEADICHSSLPVVYLGSVHVWCMYVNQYLSHCFKWWAWKGSNLRPADYESGGLVDLMGETPRILRGFLMHISDSFETRDYPETRPSCSIENELEFMASVFQRASPGDKSCSIEHDPNPNKSRKVFENWILIGIAHSGAYLDTMG